MAKRQIRIIGKELKEKLPGFFGQKINIVKKNQSVIFAYLEKIEDGMIYGRNMRLDGIRISFDDIREVIIDVAA